MYFGVYLSAVNNLNFYKDLFSEQHVEDIQMILVEQISRYQIRLTDIAYQNLLAHILIMLKRAKRGREVTYDIQIINEFKTAKEYEIASEIMAQIHRKTGNDVSDEIYYLTQNLMTSRKVALHDDTADELSEMIEALVAEIKDKTNIGSSSISEMYF